MKIIEDILVQILIHLKTFITNPMFLVPTVWVSFGCVASWFVLSAKKFQALSSNDVQTLWKSHKQFSQCKAKKFEKISKGEKIIGYRCTCGYEHKQRRPIINFGT